MAFSDTPHPAAGQTTTRIVDVLTPVALDQAFSYVVPSNLSLVNGDVVRVPFGTRETVGVVWEIRDGPGGASNLKQVKELAAMPRLAVPLMKFIDWVARYTLTPRGAVLRMALRGPDEEQEEAAQIGVRLTGALPKRLTPARARAVAAAEGGLLFGKRALAHEAGVSTSVIDGLIDEGTLTTELMPIKAIVEQPDADFAVTTFEADQKDAAAKLAETVTEGAFSVTLLEGVTGSGKTEVYFEAVAAALREGKQALILVPEIALTAQFLDRFAARFGTKPAEWHSGISGRKRERIFAAIASGDAQVVAGARSALFLPYAKLGLIIVDEEHEGAYKQDDGAHYHARDMAVVRGRIEGAPVVLASATPSLETRVNAERGRYHHIKLPTRFGGRPMPTLEPVDMRRAGPPRNRWLSPRLIEAMGQTFERGEQALLYLNRRGYAPLTLCRGCGHRFQCPNCSTWLVDHRFRRALVCHHCGHIERRPEACPSCGMIESLAACGPGVERLSEEVAELFPKRRVLVLSSDMPGGTERLRREIDAVASGEFELVIGTQLVAKGHHFPLLSLVGVVDADLGLVSGDPRAAERTFQMLQQVTGRAGRGDAPGHALIQTYQPEHPVIKALLSGDSERFYAEETRQRSAAGLPPFGRLAAIIVSATDRALAENAARGLARIAMPPEGVSVLGPAEAPIAMIRGRHRFRLLVKSGRDFDLSAWLRDWMARAPKPTGNLKISVDVDPYNFA